MRTRQLGKAGPAVSAIGLGCMGMSEFYGASVDGESRATLERALDLGVTFFDTADTYGIGHNEALLAPVLKQARSRVVLATKFGIKRQKDSYAREIDTSPAYVRSACDASLQRLGIETIDLYYAHRINPTVPIEDTVGAMADLVAAGKVRHLGLSEVSAPTLRKAHMVHPIAAVQSEYSLWTRGPEADVLPTCRELGIAFVPYSPLGRGFLSGTIDQSTRFADTDMRNVLPRFRDQALVANLELARRVKEIAADIGCTPAQLCLAWLLAQGDDLIPIPGTRRIPYLEENVAAESLVLKPATIARLDAAFPVDAAVGHRYTEEGMKGVNA